MIHHTADESKANAIARLGPIYGAAFHHSCQEFWRLSSSWDRYQVLFGSQERVDLLNRSSGSFWQVMQGLMHEHVLLGICRLTDPAKTFGEQNLSIQQLEQLDPSLHKRRLSQRVKKAIELSRFAKTWRHKVIAHNDFDQITGAANKLLPSTANKIKHAIVGIHDVLRWVQGKHFNGDMFLMDIADHDANRLLMTIDDGLRYRALRRDSGLPFEGDHDRGWYKTGLPQSERYRVSRKLKTVRGPKRSR